MVDLPDEVHAGPVDDAAQQHKGHGIGRRAGPLPDGVARAVGKEHTGDQRRQLDPVGDLVPVGGEEGDNAEADEDAEMDSPVTRRCRLRDES